MKCLQDTWPIESRRSCSTIIQSVRYGDGADGIAVHRDGPTVQPTGQEVAHLKFSVCYVE